MLSSIHGMTEILQNRCKHSDVWEQFLLSQSAISISNDCNVGNGKEA